jgi:regulator of replication initiation timing
MEEIRRTLDERIEENDYLTVKVDKLEQSNKDLRLAKDPKGEIKKLESEVAYLQS